jgi:hypothetical protein
MLFFFQNASRSPLRGKVSMRMAMVWPSPVTGAPFEVRPSAA